MNWFVPVLRHIVAAVVALFAGWIAQRLGVEVTAEDREYLTGLLTTIGAAVIGLAWVSVSKALKPYFLRGIHPGTPLGRRF